MKSYANLEETVLRLQGLRISRLEDLWIACWGESEEGLRGWGIEGLRDWVVGWYGEVCLCLHWKIKALERVWDVWDTRELGMAFDGIFFMAGDDEWIWRGLDLGFDWMIGWSLNLNFLVLKLKFFDLVRSITERPLGIIKLLGNV